jgi:predicted PurR-regulated permease PerM
MKEIFLRLNQYLFFVILVIAMLHFGKVVLVPIAFAALLSMLMVPISRSLERRGFNRSLSSFTSTLIIFIVIIGMFAVVASQFAAFKEDAPKIKQKAISFVESTQKYIERKFGVDEKKQKQIAKQQTTSTPKSGGTFLSRVINGLTTTVGTILLTLVYTFLMLYNREQFKTFFLKLYKRDDQQKVKEVVEQIATVSQKYLTGRVMSICIIFGMYSIGLSIVGIKNAILLAGVAALLTVIPYIGTVLGGLFPVLMALATEDSIQPALWAAGVLFFIQTMDNYFIEPNIVGGEVNLNAITSIFSIVAGGLLWGVPGMILFLPMAGIIKIVCDHVDELKPIGYLIGEPEVDKPSKIKLWLQEKFGKKSRNH